MAEYINRGDLTIWLNKKSCEYSMNDVVPIGWTLKGLINELATFPSADVVERKTGNWFIDGNGTLRCSECKEEALLTLDAIEGVPFSTFSESHFCPHCGAKMEEAPIVDSFPMEYFEGGGK